MSKPRTKDRENIENVSAIVRLPQSSMLYGGKKAACIESLIFDTSGVSFHKKKARLLLRPIMRRFGVVTALTI